MIFLNNRTLLTDYNKIFRRSVYLSGGINIYSVVTIAVLVASSHSTLYHKFSDRNLNGTITLHDYNFIPSMLLYTMGFYAMLLKTLAVQVCQLLPSANFLQYVTLASNASDTALRGTIVLSPTILGAVSSVKTSVPFPIS